jgi:hypothetical protein
VCSPDFFSLPSQSRGAGERPAIRAAGVSTVDFRAMHASANSDHSPCSSKTKLFHIEFSDLHVAKEDSIKPWYDQLECQLFEAEYLSDEDSVFVPAYVAAIV